MVTSGRHGLDVLLSRASGSPIYYTASPDLNGDGFTGNDPIYVPKDATDPNEIRIGSHDAGRRVHAGRRGRRALFDDFINCQDVPERPARQIMKRNSCFSVAESDGHVDPSVASEPVRQCASVQLDIINAMNARSSDGACQRQERDWGSDRSTLSSFPQQQVLTATRQVVRRSLAWSDSSVACRSTRSTRPFARVARMTL